MSTHREHIEENRALRAQVDDLLAALEDALWRWNGLPQSRRDEIIALAPDPHPIASVEGES